MGLGSELRGAGSGAAGGRWGLGQRCCQLCFPVRGWEEEAEGAPGTPKVVRALRAPPPPLPRSGNR